MKRSEIEIGARIRARVDFDSVPRGTEGLIDEDYGSGFMVAWDLPDQPLPPGYTCHDGSTPAFILGILRDGFDKDTELDYLERLGDAP